MGRDSGEIWIRETIRNCNRKRIKSRALVVFLKIQSKSEDASLSFNG